MVDRGCSCVRKENISVFCCTFSKGLIFVSISPLTQNPVVVYCIKLQNQQEFRAESYKQDLLLSTSLIHRWEMCLCFFVLWVQYFNMIIPMEKKTPTVHTSSRRTKETFFRQHTHLPSTPEGRWPKSLETCAFQKSLVYKDQQTIAILVSRSLMLFNKVPERERRPLLWQLSSWQQNSIETPKLTSPHWFKKLRNSH